MRLGTRKSRTFRAAGGQDRRLELVEALLDHAAADRRDDLGAQQDVLLHLLAAKVQEAVAQADFLAGIGLAVDLERQRIGGALHRQFLKLDLDPAGRELVVDGLGRALDHLAGDRDDGFQPQTLDHLEQRVGAVDTICVRP